MSYHTWHNYGYGICTNALENADVSRIWTLIQMAPSFEKSVRAEFDEEEIADLTAEDFRELECSGRYGIASILESVIREVENIPLCACDDYDNNHYLLYMPTYPWYVQESEVKLTEEILDQLFAKYTSVLSDEEIEVEYQSVENGG